MSGDEWHGNPPRAYGHMVYTERERCPYLYENERSKSSCKNHAHGRSYSMCTGQQNGDRRGAGGQFGYGRDRQFSDFDRKEFYGNRREFSKEHNNYNNANGNFGKKGNINFSMERSHKGMEDGNYGTAGDDSSSEKESIDSGKWSYQSSKDETPTVVNEHKHNLRWGDSWRPRGKGYRSAKGRHKGSGIGHQEKSPSDMSLKDKIYKFGVFLKNEIPQANAIQTIENGLAKCRLGLKINFNVYENKTVRGKPFFMGVLKLSGVIMGQSSGFTKKETKHKAYETALDNLTQKSVDEIFQLKDPVIEAERDKEVVSAKTSNNTCMAIKDAESAQAGNSTVSQNRDEELISADLETNHKTHVQISDADIGQAGNNKLKNEEAVSLESGGYNTHVLINADSVQTGEKNTQIINIPPGQPVNIDQRGNANNVIVNIKVHQERRPSDYVRGSDRYIDLKIQMSRRDGLTVVHAEDLENLGLEALKTEEGQLIIRSIETALDVEADGIFKGSIIIRLRQNKDSISKLKSAIETEQLHKILARIVELKKVRFAVLGKHLFLNVTACIPKEDLIEEDKCFTEKGSICIRFKSSSEDVYSKLKTKVKNGQLQRILASISEIEPVHSALSRSDLVMNVTASVTEGNERTLASDACTWKSQDQVKLLENDSSDISPSSLPEESEEKGERICISTSPCTLCKNGMKCLHHSIESEPKTEFDSSVRIKTKVENGQVQRILASTFEIEPVHSAFSRSDPVMNVTASVTEGNERHLASDACTWKSPEQMKLLENDSSDISPSSLPDTSSCTLCKNRMKCLHHSVESEPKTEFDSSVRIRTKVENGQLQRILASTSEIEPDHSALSRSDSDMNVTASVTEGNERPLASDACTWKSQDQVKLLENDSCSDISPSSLPDTSPCTLCKNGMKCLHHSVESEPKTEFDSSVRIRTKVENGQLQRILASTSEIEPDHSALSRSDPDMNVTASVTEGNERPLASDACTWKSQDQVKLLENDSCSDISPSSLPDTSPCTLCKNGMKCLHHSIEPEPKTEFDSSVRIKTKVENGQLQRILARSFEIGLFHSVSIRCDMAKHVIASLREENERRLASDTCTWKSPEQMKLLENDSSDISPSSLPDTSPCTWCNNGMKCLHHSIESEPKTEFDSSVRIKTKVENGQLQRILARSFEIGLFHSASIRCDMAKHVIASLREENERRLASDTCTWKSREQMKLLENDSSDISPSSSPDELSGSDMVRNTIAHYIEPKKRYLQFLWDKMEHTHLSVEAEPNTEFDSSDMFIDTIHTVRLEKYIEDAITRDLIHRQTQHFQETDFPRDALFIEGINIILSLLNTAKLNLDLLRKDMQDIINTEETMCVSPLCEQSCYLIHIIDMGLNVCGTIYEQIFLDRSSSKLRRIYLLRKRGLGKTTFCRKIIHDWCNAHEGRAVAQGGSFQDAAVLPMFDILFSMNLREVSFEKNLIDAICAELPSKHFLGSYLKFNGDKEMFIPDGLNEMIVQANFIENVLTPRPWKISNMELHVKDGFTVNVFMHRLYVKSCYYHHALISEMMFHNRVEIDPFLDLNFFHQRNAQNFAIKPIAKQFTEDILCDMLVTQLIHVPLHVSVQIWCENKMSFLNEVHKNYTLLPIGMAVRIKEKHKRDPNHRQMRFIYDDIQLSLCEVAHDFLLSSEKKNSLIFKETNLLNAELGNRVLGKRNKLWKDHLENLWSEEGTDRHRYRELDIINTMYLRYEREVLGETVLVAVSRLCQDQSDFDLQCWNPALLQRLDLTGTRISHVYVNLRGFTELRYLRLHSLNCELYLSQSDSVSVLIMDTLKLSSSCCDVLGSTLTHCTKLERLCIHDTDFHNCVLDLSNMTELTVLDISGVTLSSSCCDVLGSSLTHCTKLERLCIHDTDFHNCVLDLSNMTELTVLDISGVTLSSSCCDVLGSSLTHCTKLERLCIHDTDFHNCVLDLSNMTELTVLDISGVTLSSSCCDVLGSSLTHCTKLERLCIHDTDFHNCVLDLSNMTELTVLDMSGVTLPSSCCDVLGSTLTHCTKLERLCIHDTDFHNCVLDLSNMTELTVLDMSGVTLPSSCCDVLGSTLTHCTKLERLCIHDTDFHNCVLDLSNMTELTVLDMSGVTLPSSCCDVLGSTLTHCTKLERLCIHDTDFHNCVLDLSNMTELTVLDMSGVTLPSSCCDVLGSTLTHCTKLERLCIHDIDFHNCVLDLSNMTELTVLDMSGLTLSSCCCDVLGSTLTRSTKLERLCIHDTDFHDCVLDLSNMTDLTVLDISGVTLCSSCCDVLGSTLTHCTKLERFCIHDTDFHDCVLDLSNMTELTVLDISGVTLSSICCDVLGSTLTHCTKLERLCIHDTDFHDCVLDLSNMTELAVLDISGVTLSSRCCDVLGSSLTHCTKLERLCIHDTDFHNCVLDLSNMTELTVLDMSGVTLPSSCCDVLGSTLTHCTKLERLCIHDTDFHNCVLDLSNMTELTVLDMSGVTLPSSCCDVLGSTLTHCTKLERLCIHDTDFHNCVLDLSNMTELTVLDMSGVTLPSSCCDVLGSTLTHCTKLERLCIHDTDFHNCVLDLSNMTELTVLDMSGVTLPSSCCDVLGSTLTHCTKLERLCIHDIDFHNCVLDLSNMTELTVLDMSGLTLSSCCCDVLGSTLTRSTKLERLCIHDTDFHDCVLDLSNMTDLTVLDISGVTLCSSCCDVLGSTLTHCTKLERFCIHDTDFHDCVLDLSNMTELTVLDISGVTLSSICCDVLGSTLTHCTKLERLCIHDTDFHDCVLDLSNMTELAVLDISGVTLSSRCCDVLGSSLTHCTKLERLCIHDTDFHNCVLDLSNMTELTVLDMSGVTLPSSCCDVLGSTLTHCTKLERLCIHDTDFHNCVLDLSNMTELTVLDMSGVTLPSSCCDVLGSTLTHCTKLERLCIHDTDFHNCVLDLSNMTELTVLDMSGVTLPSSCCDVLGSTLTHCTKLERLCIHDTDFHNCVLDLSNMTELTVLDMSGVTLPSSCCDVLGSTLTHCTKLERLCIHDIDFHNCVLDLSNMTELTVLDMSGLTLSSCCCDVLGSTLTRSTKLERLCIHDTDFHDCVLDLSNMTDLTVLDISGVTLCSSCCDVLGSTLTHCTKLERFCIHDTDFHDCVLDLSNMTELTVLDISGVTLSSICCDVLGSTLTHCTKLERLCIHDTDFHDCVLDLSNMTELAVLDISGVTLSSRCCDVLGSTLTHCTKLERLCIHDTDFHNCLLDLSNMTELTVLDISGVTLSSSCCDVLGNTLGND